jgi:hypothetical protein
MVLKLILIIAIDRFQLYLSWVVGGGGGGMIVILPT